MNDIVEQLRSARMMVNYGHGDVRDEPDALHEGAADEIERLREALGPFAKVAEPIVNDSRFDIAEWSRRLSLLTVGQFRAAHRALSQPPEMGVSE